MTAIMTKIKTVQTLIKLTLLNLSVSFGTSINDIAQILA